MDTQPAFGFTDLLRAVVGETTKAISERPGETTQQHFARSQAVAFMIMAFMPRDMLEAMLAGHCLMFHEAMNDTFHRLMLAAEEGARRECHRGLVAQNRAFLANLTMLLRLQLRPAEGRRDAPDASVSEAADVPSPRERPSAPPPSASAPSTPPPSGTAPAARPMNRAERRQAARAQKHALSRHGLAARHDPVRAGPATPSPAEIPGLRRPSPEAVAECVANRDAMAALQAGDAAGFAQALGIARPDGRFLAAAAVPGGPFDPAAGRWSKDPVADGQSAKDPAAGGQSAESPDAAMATDIHPADDRLRR